MIAEFDLVTYLDKDGELKRMLVKPDWNNAADLHDVTGPFSDMQTRCTARVEVPDGMEQYLKAIYK